MSNLLIIRVSKMVIKKKEIVGSRIEGEKLDPIV